jgi:hypothetical protein
MPLETIKNSTEQAVKECKKDPKKCVRQLLLDGVVIVASYGLLLYLVEGRTLAWTNIARFYAVFLVIAFVFRYLDLDFQEQLTRVAGFQVGTKLFMLLTA